VHAPAIDDEGRMPFVEHIRELRSRLFKAVGAIMLSTVAAFVFYEEIGAFLLEPACDANVIGVGNKADCNGLFVNQGLLGPFSLALKLSLAAGLVLACPIWLFQLWAFLAPGLHRSEKRYTYAFVATGVPLFLTGAAVSYLILPKAVDILLGFTLAEVSNLLTPDEYFSFVIRMILVFGLAFELPLILMLLNLSGIVSARRMASWWRLMVLGITLFAAMATPTPDPLTMLTLAAPMCALFFLAVGLAWINDKRRERRRRKDPDAQLSPDEASVVDTRASRLDDLDDLDDIS
jgi:sec-independent protein translocase protein TatC